MYTYHDHQIACIHDKFEKRNASTNTGLDLTQVEFLLVDHLLLLQQLG